MKYLWFLILVGYAVKCDDSSYYVVEIPEDEPSRADPFKVYWNVPTMQCKSKKIPFENLYEKFGIIQNSNDSFRGEKISILYDPGLFPALLKNETSGKFKFRNGGVPQEGNLELHEEMFRDTLNQSVPDPNFSGVGIIDFESWRPTFRQNFGVLVPYKDISVEIEKNEHWWWPKQWIQDEAKRRFEVAARKFMQNTVTIAKKMRPNALWGYYGFPYCFNMANNHMRESCADKVPEENDRLYWLWSGSTALFPSIYSSRSLTSSQLSALVRQRVREAARVRRKASPILPYFWFRYREGGYYSKEDLNAALGTLYKSDASGFIIWGSSNDVNTVTKCEKLLNYVENVLGPAIVKYTRPTNKVKDDDVSNDDTNKAPPTTDQSLSNNENNTDLDPEFHWQPPENYTQDIKDYVQQELKKKGLNNTENRANETESSQVNNSVLMDEILDSLLQHKNKSDLNRVEEILNFIENNNTHDRNDLDSSQSRINIVTAYSDIKSKHKEGALFSLDNSSYNLESSKNVLTNIELETTTIHHSYSSPITVESTTENLNYESNATFVTENIKSIISDTIQSTERSTTLTTQLDIVNDENTTFTTNKPKEEKTLKEESIHVAGNDNNKISDPINYEDTKYLTESTPTRVDGTKNTKNDKNTETVIKTDNLITTESDFRINNEDLEKNAANKSVTENPFLESTTSSEQVIGAASSITLGFDCYILYIVLYMFSINMGKIIIYATYYILSSNILRMIVFLKINLIMTYLFLP